MYAAGMITEYNPLHGGHVRLMRKAREALGRDTAIICCMSGDFVQRGGFAVVRRQARAKAAVLSGADLVLELPLPWAVSSAEGFAEGAVSILNAAGVVDFLVFGSESGDTQSIQRTADLLLSPAFPSLLREELKRGDSFPAARQRAAVRLAAAGKKKETGVETGTDAKAGTGTESRTGTETGKETAAGTETETGSVSETGTGTETDIAALLSRPNDALAVEYCKALRRSGSVMRPAAVLRTGAAHDSGDLRPGAYPSASAIRDLLRRGETETALSWMAPAMAEVFREEIAAGRAPVFGETVERAVLARLRSMSREEFAALDEGREGLGYRLYRASREASSVGGVLETAKTRRYPLSRLRRMVLWAYLGMTPRRPAAPAYLRPLAASPVGQTLLARMRTEASLPVLIRPKDVNHMCRDAVSLFELEARAADLYALACPDLSALRGGSLWRDRILRT